MPEFYGCGADGDGFVGGVESYGYFCFCGRARHIFHYDADDMDDAVTRGSGDWFFSGWGDESLGRKALLPDCVPYEQRDMLCQLGSIVAYC